jgi:hypothetical protein
MPHQRTSSFASDAMAALSAAHGSRTFVYPVEAKHSTVLGYGATSQMGKKLWASLVWAGVLAGGLCDNLTEDEPFSIFDGEEDF